MVNLSSVHNVSNFVALPARSLEVANTPGTAKVLNSNLTGLVFFKQEILRFKKSCRLIICLIIFCRPNKIFLLFAIKIVIALNVLFYFFC